MTVVYEQKAPLIYRTALEPSISVLTTDRQRHTLAHRHNTGGFGTPMLVLLLSIFQHRRRADYRTGQTHSCLFECLPPLLRREGVGLSERHNDQLSHSISTELSCFCFFFGSPSLSSDQQFLIVGFLRRAGRQEGCSNRGSRCRSDIEEGVRTDAGGRRVAESSGCRDAGEVDAEREPCLLQGFLRHGKGLQLLLTVGHVGVLATSADTIQACLRKMTRYIKCISITTKSHTFCKITSDRIKGYLKLNTAALCRGLYVNL